MFRLDVLHEQWLLLALGGGLVLTFALALYYQTMGRSRAEVSSDVERPLTSVSSLLGRLTVAIPWLVLVAIIAITAWAAIMPIHASNHPPNW